jgi:hypothetical protein
MCYCPCGVIVERNAEKTMASTRRMVTFNGILTGQGLNSTCVVSAVEVKHAITGDTALSRIRIQSVAKALPEGRYELLCNGGKVMFSYEGGFWKL